MRRKIAVLGLATSLLVAVGVVGAGSSVADRGATLAPAAGIVPSWCKANVTRGRVTIKNDCMLSSGGRMFFDGPDTSGGESPKQAQPSFGSNKDAADPNEDLASGQSETAIAASGQNIVAAWNDATGFITFPSAGKKASLTGVGWSGTGGAIWHDLVGLPNSNQAQKWFGDPTVVAIDSTHFVVGSLYLPACFAVNVSCNGSKLELAVSVGTVPPSGPPTFTQPIIAANGGSIFSSTSGFLDKEFLSYDPVSRTLAMSYTDFRFDPPTNCGNGEIDLVRATVPADPATLSSGDWSAPIVIGPEIGGDCSTFVEQEGAYPAVAPGGDIYVAWERNWFTNLGFNGDPYVYIDAAYLPSGSTTVANTVVASVNQPGATRLGGFKSLGSVAIAGYNRGLGNDFPRIAYNTALGQVDIAWNSGSLHPLGDIFVKAIAPTLSNNASAPVYRVDDDNSFALHFLPGLSVRSDGSICTSWYDRRAHGADSAVTDYWGECRPNVSTNTADFVITTGPTDWTNTSTFIFPNFGDYTDNASDGLTTYYLWSDGRVGVPNPFFDLHT
jgi:hypothetical protein